MPQFVRMSALFLAMISVLAAAVIPARATTLRKMQLPEIVSRADRIVHARAVEQKVRWDPSGRRIYTDTTFVVEKAVKGSGPGRMTVSLLGGRIDPVEMHAIGTPRFRIGEEVVLFTGTRPDGKIGLVGFSQGVMRIQSDAEGRKFATLQDPTGVGIVKEERGRSAPGSARLQAPLDDVLERLRLMAETDTVGAPIRMTPLEAEPVEE